MSRSFRPLVLNYQEDSNTYNLDDQFMIGDDLLLAPILSLGLTSRLVYLPRGTWYDYWTNKKYSGGTMIRVDAPLETVPMSSQGINITINAPQGGFKTPNRILSFLIPTRLSPTLVSLDGKSLSRAGQDGSAWYKSGEILIVRIPDDGKPHSISIRS